MQEVHSTHQPSACRSGHTCTPIALQLKPSSSNHYILWRRGQVAPKLPGHMIGHIVTSQWWATQDLQRLHYNSFLKHVGCIYVHSGILQAIHVSSRARPRLGFLSLPWKPMSHEIEIFVLSSNRLKTMLWHHKFWLAWLYSLYNRDLWHHNIVLLLFGWVFEQHNEHNWN